MGYLIDTNVWSELQKGQRANPGVQRWFECIAAEELYLSVMVVGEVRRGIERLRRRDPQQAGYLEQRLEQLQDAMAGRILPISSPVAERWGRINVPDPLPVVDGLLAATALEHGLVLIYTQRARRRKERSASSQSVRGTASFSVATSSLSCPLRLSAPPAHRFCLRRRRAYWYRSVGWVEERNPALFSTPGHAGYRCAQPRLQLPASRSGGWRLICIPDLTCFVSLGFFLEIT
jgi:hypothetical protein